MSLFKPTYPGEVLKNELLSRNMIQKELPEIIGIKQSLLSKIINGKRALSADIAIFLESVLNIYAESWLKFQMYYEINKAKMKKRMWKD